MILFFVGFYTNAQNSQVKENVANIVAIDSTFGTFQFYFRNRNVNFWPIDEIQKLYPEIERKRESYNFNFWEYSDNLVIIIYPKDVITSKDFIKNNSPYIQKFKFHIK